MNERKIDAGYASMIARKYFEGVLGTPYLYFETIKAKFNEELKMWIVEAYVQPLYSELKRRYVLEISAEGEVKNVEQVSSSTEA